MNITPMAPGIRRMPNPSFQSRPVAAGPAIRFQGDPTTQAAQHELLSYQQLKELVLKDDNPYLGKIPAAFMEASGLSEADWQAGLDWLAFQLQDPNNIKSLKPGFFKNLFQSKAKSQNPVERLFQQNRIKVRVLGEGIAGNVYQLNLNGQDFAFKVFKQGEGRVSMDAYRESATGLFFTAKDTSNISDFYASNPRGHWTLMEFISPDAQLTDRAGTRLSQQGYKLSDDNDKNKVNDIRVDHGGVVVQEGVGFMAPDAFKRFSQLKAAKEVQSDALSVLSVERPKNLATTEADWENEADMCETIPLDTLSMLQYQGNFTQSIRQHGALRRPVQPFNIPDENKEGSKDEDMLADLPEAQRQAMQDVGESAQRRRPVRPPASQNP